MAEPEWPSPIVREETRPLGFGHIAPPGEALDSVPRTVQSPLGTGLFAGRWGSYADTPDLPHDQRGEDGDALVFDRPPLEEDLEILGAPVVDLELSTDRPVAMVTMRLSDVAPDDKTTRVTYGMLNLCQRDSREQPMLLEPGERYRVRVQLNDLDVEISGRGEERYSFRDDDFDSVRGETHWGGFRRGDWSVHTVTRIVLTSTRTHFRIRADLDAYEGDSRVYSRSWDRSIPRDLV